MKRTNLFLSERQTAALDQQSAVVGVSRSELVRRIIDRSLGENGDDLGDDLAAIDESFGALAGDDWLGGLRDADDARARHLDDLMNR